MRFSPSSAFSVGVATWCGGSLSGPDAVPGVVSLAQSFGARAHWHPHLHLLVTDDAFRREGWFGEDTAASMLAWPHSGFGGS